MDAPATPKRPWYQRKQEYVELADRYVLGMVLARAGTDLLMAAEVRSLGTHSFVKLIFESNRLESAGLSEGETKKLIDQFAQLKVQPDGTLRGTNASPVVQEAVAAGRVVPRVVFEGSSRPEREVLQHMNAVRMVLEADRAYDEAVTTGVVSPALLSEAWIKQLHQTLAEGLLPADSEVPAGEYRVDDRRIDGVDLKLPAPELLAPMMAELVKRTNARLAAWRAEQAQAKEQVAQVLTQWASASPAQRELVRGEWVQAVQALRDVERIRWELAAWVSYEFACIHPFPDFNGRVSRLLLALLLGVLWVPMWVSLRGDAKGKHRYLTALKHADRGKLDAYTALIAKSVVDAGQQVDANLARAGLPSLLSLVDTKVSELVKALPGAGGTGQKGEAG